MVNAGRVDGKKKVSQRPNVIAGENENERALVVTESGAL
jgi:hypothetical protein